MTAKKIAAVLSGLFLCLGHEGLGRESISHHRDLQDTVCFIHTNWDPRVIHDASKKVKTRQEFLYFSVVGPGNYL